ncbi:MAG: alginate lyase family protein [Burkholderiales bacterium]|nr:alginate lyase family protein [Burkholderiales bacterium]
MSLATLGRYWHTVRHLRPVQVYGRLRFRATTAKPDLRSAPPLRGARGAWLRCARRASMTGAATLRILGVERTIACAADWNRSDWAKLWRYNAHYFDDLAASDAEPRAAWHRDLVARWIAENPPGHGDGWEPYPLSLRIVNWIKATLCGQPLDTAARASLAVQVRFLRERLEVHLLGNHLWANAKALVFAGAFFAGREADGWRERGLSLLRREAAEQILADGGHFERSPMYHALITEDVLDLVQLARAYPGCFAEGDIARWHATSARMLHWLEVMMHPDGELAFFNDAAMDVAPTYAALTSYAHTLGVAAPDAALPDLVALPESGYVRLGAGSAVLIADVAPVGPDYLPGHAHADTLSFELSLAGQRVLVNGGTSTYEANAQRLRERGTAMHNTVCVDGRDSSEVWSSFRVARRARPFAVRWGRADDGTLWIEAAHDGYRRLPGKVVHRRRWELRCDGLVVLDALDGRCAEAVARYRFAPGLTVAMGDDRAGGTVDGAPVRVRWRCEGAQGVAGVGGAVVEAGTWHPRFGVSKAVEVLALPVRGGALRTSFAWS